MASKVPNWNKNLNDWLDNTYNPAPDIHVDNLENDDRALTPSKQQYKPVNQSDNAPANNTYNAPVSQPVQQPQSNIFKNLFNAIFHANDNADSMYTDQTNDTAVQNMNSKQLQDFINQSPKMPQDNYNKLIAMQTDKENSEAIDNIKNPLLKGLASLVFAPSKQTPFLNRVKSTGVNTITGGAANLTQTDTGNGAKNFVADMLGSGLGFVAPQPGAAQSLGNVLDRTIGQPVANKLAFMGNSTPAKYAQSALKTGAEFAGLNAVESGLQGKDIQDVGKSAGTGLLQGALFGAGGKFLGDIAPRIKNAALPDWKTTYRDSLKLNNPNGVLKTDATYNYNFNDNPQAINSKTWYHGTGTPNLTADQLTPTKTNIEGLFGQGVYLTDNPKIAEGYANARSRRTGTPTIYQSNVNINKAINLEKPMPNDVYNSFEQIAGQLSKNYDAPYVLENMKDLKSKGATGDEIYRQFSTDVADMSHDAGLPTSELYDYFTDLNANLKDKGYDAYTHVGGKRTGNDAHQVAIMLDPNGEFGGTSGNVTKLTPYQNPIAKLNPNLIPKSNLTPVVAPKLNPSELTPNDIINKPISPVEPTVNQRPSIGATDRTQMQTAVVTGKNNSSFKDKFNNFLNTAKTELYDTNAPLSKVDTSTYRTATNAKKVGGTVDYILNDKLVDRQGNPLGEGLKSIASDIPKNQEKEFFNYILQKHNIDRAANDKSIDSSFSSDQSAKAVNLIEQKYPEFKAVGDRLTGFINNFMGEWGNKSGLINDDLWKSLQDTYKNYIPTNRSFNELEKGFSKTNGKGFVDQSKPISRATGSDRDVINPIENIANIVNRTVRTARYNQVGQDLLNAIRNNPEKMAKDAQIIPEGEAINPNVNNVVSVLENGNPVNIQINNKDLLESLQGVNKNMDFTKLENVVGAANKGFKSLITTKNPVFGIRNMARDIPTAYVYGNEHNPLKFGANYVKAMKSLITNDATAQQYKALGGEGANFFNRDKAYQSANDLMGRKLVTDKGTGEITGSKNPNIFATMGKKINNGIETFNNVIESTPRLAEFKSTLDKGGNTQDALYNAGEITTNFSRGGNSIKRLDKSVPYLNASVQGLGKFLEQATKHPVATLSKGVLAATVPSVAVSMLNNNNPNYNKLDNRTKDANFLFPNPAGPKDADGNPETFIKIPKSRELGVLFGDLAERAIRQGQGDQEAFKGYFTTGGLKGIKNGSLATSFAPANPLENNIYAPIISNLPSNKDFAGRTIVPQSMQDLSPKYQYDENTSNIAKSIGQLTNLSPKQIDYVIKSYTGVLGQMSQNATTPSKFTSPNSATNIFMPVTGQFKSDVLYNNQDLQNFYDNVQKAKTAAADKNFVENVDPKTVTDEEGISNGYTRALKEISALGKQASQASIKGDEETARQAREEMIKIAQDANNGTFPETATQIKARTKSTTTKTSTRKANIFSNR